MLRTPPQPVLTDLEPHQVIVRPLITEKSHHKAERYNQYAFEVCPSATKADVKKAVEEVFNVKVLWVNIQSRRGKQRRYRWRKAYTKAWKKAVVKLDPEYRINLY
ncbi:MAG: 50S ribosomal protein L23 [Thermogutta sp.]